MKYVFVDYRISNDEENSLLKLGYETIKCGPCEKLYDAINGHPDILLHLLDNKKIIIHKDSPLEFKEKLLSYGFEVLYSNNCLESSYPKDIILNAVSTPTHFIHNLKYTDDMLLTLMNNKIKLNVKQGYTKCSTAVISHNAFITSDKVIHKTLINEGFDVLLLPPGDILLPGLDYGFIGGTCGLLDKNTIAFFGSLNYYPHKDEVISFLDKHNVKPVYLYDGPLIDRGSLIAII